MKPLSVALIVLIFVFIVFIIKHRAVINLFLQEHDY